MSLNTKTTVLIATFSPWKNGRRLPTNGNLEPLLDFFVPKTAKTVLIDQPYPGSDFILPRIEVYSAGKRVRITGVSWWMYCLYPFLRAIKSNGTHIIYKVRDFLSVIDWVLRDQTHYELFVGLEAINGLAGIILKKLGRIDSVVYYVSDYSPNRYKQQWFNRLYLWLDRFCASYADYIWDVSAAMQPARISVGLDPQKSAPVLIVPNALYPAQISFLPLSRVEPYSLVFMGTLGEENGPDLAIKALTYLLPRFPLVKLHIIGGGEDLLRLRKLTADFRLKKFVIFHGFIADRTLLSQILKKYALALAPYAAIPGSPRWYGDATKIRAYLAAGLPVVTTQVPPLGEEAAAAGAAVIVRDDPQQLAAAVGKIFMQPKLLATMKKHAVAFAKDNTWEKEFSKALRAMT